MAYQQYHIGQRGNTVEYNTAEILRQLKADGGAPKAAPKKGPRNDKLRIAQLYGSGVGNIKAVQGRLKPIIKGDESDYHTHKRNNDIDYGAVVEEKLDGSPLFHKHGVIKLEQMWSGSRMALADLIKQFHQHFDVALSRNEAAGLAKQWGLIVIEKKRTQVNFNQMLTKLYALHESMRKKRDIGRREEEEQLKKRKDDREQQRPNVPGEDALDADELRRRAGLIQLQRGLYKLNIAVPQFYMLEPQHFLTIVNSEVHGALTVGLLRDFCRYNLKMDISTGEAAALLIRLDYGAGKVPLSTWLYELKKLGLGMKGLLDPIVLDFESGEISSSSCSPLALHKGDYDGHGHDDEDDDEDDDNDRDWDAQMAGVMERMDIPSNYKPHSNSYDTNHSPHNPRNVARIPLPAQLVQVRLKDALPAEATANGSALLSPIVDKRKRLRPELNPVGTGHNDSNSSSYDKGSHNAQGQQQQQPAWGMSSGRAGERKKGGKVIHGSPAHIVSTRNSSSNNNSPVRVRFGSPASPDSGINSTGTHSSSSPGDDQLEELSIISSKILDTLSKKPKNKYNFHSSGINIPSMDPQEADRVLSKKQQHSPQYERQRGQVVRVSSDKSSAKLVS